MSAAETTLIHNIKNSYETRKKIKITKFNVENRGFIENKTRLTISLYNIQNYMFHCE